MGEIRAAYVHAYGENPPHLPDWLESVENELNSWKASGPGKRHQTAVARVLRLQQAIARLEDEHETAPYEVRAILQHELAIAWCEHPRVNPARSLEIAHDLCVEALQNAQRDRYPRLYATLQQTLGTIYRDRVKGRRGENIEHSLACYHAALAIFTPEDFPIEYAQCQQKLAVSHLLRVTGKRRENLEQAIRCCQEALHIYNKTEQTAYGKALVDWALSNIYWARIEGDTSENREQAIAFCQQALRVLTLEDFPYDFAQCQNTLGITYSERLVGEKRENIERAITCYHQSLRIWTPDAFPYSYARVQNNLGVAYIRRIAGDAADNWERAIACYQHIQPIHTFEDFPYDFAATHNNLSIAYLHRVRGSRRENIELAITYAREARRVWTLDAQPYQYAKLQNNLGQLYLVREAGDRSDNLEEALTFFQEALPILVRHAHPYEYAQMQENRGNAYLRRIAGVQAQNLEKALEAFQEALSTLTLNTFPGEHREVQLKRGEALFLQGNWHAAHAAYTAVRDVEDLLIALGSGATGHDAVLKNGQSAVANDGFALIRLGRIEEAAVVIESGRARGLTTALQLDAADPRQIRDDERRAHYISARQAFTAAQALLQAPLPPTMDEDQQRHEMLALTRDYRAAKATFDARVAEIRAAQDPAEFLHAPLHSSTILQAAEECGQGHALVYLAATPRGGFALAACTAQPDRQSVPRFVTRALPALTNDFVNELLETRLEGKITGGFGCAQQGRALDLLLDWPGQSLQEKTVALLASCETHTHTCSLATSAQAISALPQMATLFTSPVEAVDEAQRAWIANLLNREILDLELARCLPRLRDKVLAPLARWLCEEKVTGLTCIPCGLLGAFPLAAALASDDILAEKGIAASVAPNARSLLGGRYDSTARSGIATLGNPYPAQQQLRWGEAEAFTLARLGSQLGLPAQVRVQWEATRAWLLEVLGSAYVVDASCHGAFEARDFLRSRLLLAKEEALTLADLLSHQVNLRGLRLIILSACQTGLLDLEGACDEVRSLAAGMLQAGAAAALAALWSVDDKATYLLVVRFAQEWFEHLTSEPPAAALARAQRWLRNVTNRELQQWEATMPVHASEGTRGIGTTGGYLPSSLRFDAMHAQDLVQSKAERQEPDACPYAEPAHWIGFQITGW